MPGRPTRRRDGEVVALAFNQKEQRLLEKSKATLRLEASYSLKLLELDNRTVKVHFRHLKDKVAKLRSYLAPDVINELRQLEAEGKLRPAHPPVGGLASAFKIAATARRLRLPAAPHGSGGRHQPGRERSSSVLPSLEPPPSPVHHGAPPVSLGLLKRRNSVSGVFMDAPPLQSADSGRPASAGVSLMMGRLDSGQLGDRQDDLTGTGRQGVGRKDGTVTAPGTVVSEGPARPQPPEAGLTKAVETRRRVAAETSTQTNAVATSIVNTRVTEANMNPTEPSATRPADSSVTPAAQSSIQPPVKDGSKVGAAANSGVRRLGGSPGHLEMSPHQISPHQMSPHQISPHQMSPHQRQHEDQRVEDHGASSSPAGVGQSGSDPQAQAAATVTVQWSPAQNTQLAGSDTHRHGRGVSAPTSTTLPSLTSPPSTTLPSLTSPPRGSSSHAAGRTPFCSHTAATDRDRAGVAGGEEKTGRPQSLPPTPRPHHTPLDRASSFLTLLQDDGLKEVNEGLYEERRAELMEDEQLRAADITRRKDKFLQDMDQYLRDHPAPTPFLRHRRVTLTRKTSRQRGGGGGGDQGAGNDETDDPALLRRRKVEFNLSPTALPEADYRDRLMGLWKDMNKCRYLRLPDDMLDRSGVNTLATDTLRLYQVLRHRD